MSKSDIIFVTAMNLVDTYSLPVLTDGRILDPVYIILQNIWKEIQKLTFYDKCKFLIRDPGN